MADEKDLYEPDIISVTDENGEEILFELLERYENDDGVYVAITEYRDDDEEIVDGDYEVIILKVINDGDEEYQDGTIVFFNEAEAVCDLDTPEPEHLEKSAPRPVKKKGKKVTAAKAEPAAKKAKEKAAKPAKTSKSSKK